MSALSLLCVIIYSEKDRGVNNSLLIQDVRTFFMDDPMLWPSIKNKIIVILLFWLAVGSWGLMVKKNSWKIKIWKWNYVIQDDSKFTKAVWWVIFGGLVFILTILVYTNQPKKYNGDIKWKKDFLIAHAAGGINDDVYTNSKEAFETNYKKGFRTMEIDFARTKDGQIVCWHEWDNPILANFSSTNIPTKEDFLNAKAYGKYTTMSLEDLFDLMKKYEDVYIVTDTKDKDPLIVEYEFGEIVRIAQKMDSMGLLNRFIVQLYTFDMYDVVESQHHFPNYILTLYQTGGYGKERFIEKCRFCKVRNISIITMPEKKASGLNIDIANRYGIDIYVHTVNDLDSVDRDKEIGIKGFYTDFVSPEAFY